MRFFIPAVIATAALAGSFWLGHAVATRTAPRALPEQREDLQQMRASIDSLTRSVSLLAVVQPRTVTVDHAIPSAPPALPAAQAMEASDHVAEGSPAPARRQDEERLMRAQTVLDVATQRGAWTRHDEDVLRELRVESPDTDWVPFMQKLAASLNDGKLRPPPMQADSDT